MWLSSHHHHRFSYGLIADCLVLKPKRGIEFNIAGFPNAVLSAMRLDHSSTGNDLAHLNLISSIQLISNGLLFIDEMQV